MLIHGRAPPMKNHQKPLRPRRGARSAQMIALTIEKPAPKPQATSSWRRSRREELE